MACPRTRTVGLGQRQRLAGGDRELQGDKVEPGHLLGDGVLHLQPGVHLEEEVLLTGDQNSTVPALT
jgi:hypothetical protein